MSEGSTTLVDTTGDVPVCGDGIVVLPEMCDDSNVLDDDGCSSQCMFEYQIVFISSTTFGGALGGVQGGDDKCNTLAKSQPALAGRTFIAWLSSPESNAKDRLGVSALPYRLADGKTVVANNTADLLDTTLLAPINHNETGAISGGSLLTWTGTKADGTVGNDHCSAWTLGAVNTNGMIGNGGAVLAAWTASQISTCNLPRRIYCFQKAL
jgi:cysteine-rich repeat protein